MPRYPYPQCGSLTYLCLSFFPQDGCLRLLQEYSEFHCYTSWCIDLDHFLKCLVQWFSLWGNQLWILILNIQLLRLQYLSLSKLSVTISLTLALISPSDSPQHLYICPVKLFKKLLGNWDNRELKSFLKSWNSCFILLNLCDSLDILTIIIIMKKKNNNKSHSFNSTNKM